MIYRSTTETNNCMHSVTYNIKYLRIVINDTNYNNTVGEVVKWFGYIILYFYSEINIHIK